MPDHTLQQRVEYALSTTIGLSTAQQARTLIEHLGLHEVYTIAWDGELSMSGEPHRASVSAEISYESAENLLKVKYPGSWNERHPGARIERRIVTDWERT